MIRRLCLLSLAATLLASLPAPAMVAATDHPGSVAILLGVERVRQELQLNSLQKAVLDSLRSEYKTAARAIASPLPQTTDERKAAEQKLAALNDRYNARALSVLNDKQKVEFVQIERKVLGPLSIYTPSVQKSLGLSQEQRDRIEKVRLQGLLSVAKVNRQYEEGKFGYQDRLERLRKLKAANGVTLMKILTPEQKASFQALGGRKSAA